MKTICIIAILLSAELCICCHTNQKDYFNQQSYNPALIKEEINVINQTLRYLNPAESKPNWETNANEAEIVNGNMYGEPVLIGFMSGIFMPIDTLFDQRIREAQKDWRKRFPKIDSIYLDVYKNLLTVRGPELPLEAKDRSEPLPIAKRLLPSGADDIIWLDRDQVKDQDKYDIGSLTHPSWIKLYYSFQKKDLNVPYKWMGTLSISHVSISKDKHRACYLYVMWGHNYRFGVVFARKINGRWKQEGDQWLSIS
ncbi:hypothetical protein [Larkinella sp. C7]|jgi:hypothetical protein|uniref:hypothetical protein n=1 Tax=Larkinella sp. C7 TaxID=2576607 RepID=UPI0011112CD3|nr:hypothetical protein [Larkinella sp. C7]